MFANAAVNLPPLQRRPAGEASPSPFHLFHGVSALHGLAHWAPERRVTTEEVEASVIPEVARGLLMEERIGIRAKRVCDADMSITDMAMAAVQRLLTQGDFDGQPIDLSTVDLLIYYSVARECAEPATATFIQDRLGLESAIAFDISDACLGFTDAWYVADALIATGRIRRALLVSAERITPISDTAVRSINAGENPRDHYAALSLGDGASAALVGPKRAGGRAVELVTGGRASYCEHSELCILPALNQPMITKAGRLFNIALNKFIPMAEQVVSHSGWTMDDIEIYITHQASMPSIEKAGRMLGKPVSMAPITLDEYGNMASVSVPFTLSKALRERAEWTPARILMIGFGSGLGVGVFTLECR